MDLERYDDNLYIGSTPSLSDSLQYTGQRLPPDIVSEGDMLYMTFETDFGYRARGFNMQLSVTDMREGMTSQKIKSN